ncbi:MAG: sigma-70 family RNA polymerase sigma factor [Dehalococcoidia bacterium]
MFDDRQQQAAFEVEILPHLDAAYRLAYALTGRQQDAEDLVQDACLRAYANFKGYRQGTNARAWLLTILRHVHLNNHRRSRARALMVSLQRHGEEDDPFDPADTLTPGPEEQTIQNLDRQMVLDALAELPEAFRSVLELVDLTGLHYAEAAQILGCPVGTVMSRLSRGRLQLARRLRLRAGVAEER